jgi:hypothetical protein
MRKLALFAAALAVAAVTLLAPPSVQAESTAGGQPAADLADLAVDEALVRQKMDQRLHAILRATLRERADQRAAAR